MSQADIHSYLEALWELFEGQGGIITFHNGETPLNPRLFFNTQSLTTTTIIFPMVWILHSKILILIVDFYK